MKKILSVLSLLLFVSSSFGQWKWLNPKPSGVPNNKIIFTSVNNGFLFNTNGDLFSTSNQGASWQLYQSFPMTSQMELHDSTGVIIGSTFIYLSTDNGNNWSMESIPTSGSVRRVDIVSRDTIILLAQTSPSALSTLIISTDRGQHWSNINTSVNFNNKAFDFVDSKTGYATGWSGTISNFGVFKTSDGGLTWQLIYKITTSSEVVLLKFYDAKFGIAFHEFDKMLRTTDGGLTWTKGNGAVTQRVLSVEFVGRDTLYAVGESGQVYKTIDAGLNWTWAGAGNLIDQHDFYSSYFFNSKTGFVTGLRGRILKTTDGGATWQQHSPFYENITALSMVDSTTGYTSNGVNIYKTTDAGESWSSKFSLGTTWSSYRIFNNSIFFNADTGFFTATNSAHIYKTYDAGNNWKVIYPGGGYYEYVSGMSFINSKVGYISLRTANAYNLFKTTDGGETWSQVGSYHNLYKLHFLNENTGYATQYRKVVRTADAGNTWTEVLSTDYELNSIFFIDAAKGFAAGDQGHLLATSDSGRTWQTIPFENFYQDFQTVKFANEMVGYLSAEGGTLFKTIDGGQSWQKKGPNSFYTYTSIGFTGDSMVYIGGGHGSLLKNRIAEFRIDSLKVSDITACGASVTAKVIAAASSVDSIWIQYGPYAVNFDSTKLAIPGVAFDTIVNAGLILKTLSPANYYNIRLKIFYEGAYYYSDPVNFLTIAQPVPVITASANILSSSATTGNQWYLDGTLIPGAVNQQYQATSSGIYTVKATQNNCPGIFSAGYNLTITSTIDPVLNSELRIYPNPGITEVTLDNDRLRSLLVQISDINGKVLYTTEVKQRRGSISINHLAAGIYIIKVTDLKTKRMMARQILKM